MNATVPEFATEPAGPAPGHRAHRVLRDHIADLSRRYSDNFHRVISSRWRHRYYYQRLNKLIGHIVLPGSRVLDIGCMRGDMLASLTPAYGVGIDICPTAVEAARQRHPDLHFRVLAGEDAAELNETFDYVILSNVIGEVYDFRILLEAVRSVCHPRTRVVISSYSRLWQPVLTLADWLRSRTALTADNWLPPDEVDNMLHLADFEVIRRHNSILLPLGVPIVAELFNRWISPLPIINHLCLQSFCIARPRQLRPADRPQSSFSVVVPARNEAGHI
ncbi:MAG: class I SAM-dependent methyltransferase, partial [Phycisphaerales bacterium]